MQTTKTIPMHDASSNDGIIARFIRDMTNAGRGDDARRNVSTILTAFSTFVNNKPFAACTDDDFNDFLNAPILEKDGTRRPAAESYHNQMLSRLNTLRRKYLGMEKLDRPYRAVPELEPIKIDEENEAFGKVLAGCRCDKDRVLCYLAHYGGMRVGEIAILVKRCFTLAPDHVIVDFERPKTKKKGIPRGHVKIAIGSEVIKQYLARLDGPGSWLFPAKYSDDHQAPADLARQWKRLNDRAGITGKTNIHHQRHARSTELATRYNMTDKELCVFMGWSQNSMMPRLYVNCDIEAVNNKILAAEGVTTNERRPVARSCPACGAVNPNGTAACNKCGTPFDNEVQAGMAEFMEFRDMLPMFKAMAAKFKNKKKEHDVDTFDFDVELVK